MPEKNIISQDQTYRIIADKISPNNKSLSYYFYIASGETAGTEFVKNLYKFYYGFVKQRSDLLFLRFSINVKNGDVNQKEEKLKSFIKSFYPSFRKELPASFFS